jgi:3-oxoacyl-(acyl-carrier-protein) synthase/acyl carrier protein/SAM-dependent methyltransferase
MLSVLNRYSHGYVAIPVIDACRRQGLFQALHVAQPIILADLAKELRANEGALHIALRLLESLGWVVRDHQNAYYLSPRSEVHKLIPQNIMGLMTFPFADYLEQNTERSLKEWIELSGKRWGISDAMISDFLDGMLVIPLLLALKEKGDLEKTQHKEGVLFSNLRSSVKEEITELFVRQGWLHSKQSVELTEIGRFVADRIFITATVVSYRPMLCNIGSVLFGDCQSVFQRDELGHERHVDRRINVIGSGFQHEKYFADMEAIIVSIFDREPFDRQPKCIADMGCGDGTLLKRIYEIIEGKSLRGKVLDEYPIKLIGVDFNEQALKETERNLQSIDNVILLKGDIGNPAQIIKDLGGENPEDILHVRSFLDHDRPYLPPADRHAENARSAVTGEAVYMDQAGRSISPAAVAQSLVEHFKRWSAILGQHGMVVLEVHCLEPRIIRQNKDQSESLHFDAYHRFSQQLLVEAEQFIMAAAEAGLFPNSLSKKYPKTLNFSRITLNHFARQDHSIRQARIEELPTLIEFEAGHTSMTAASLYETLKKRLLEYPKGQCVIEIAGEIVAVIYTQRISREDYEHYENPNAAWQHTIDGSLVELLALRCRSEQYNNHADILLDFVEYWCGLINGVEKVVINPSCYESRYSARKNDGNELAGQVRQHMRPHLETVSINAEQDSLLPEREIEAFAARWLLCEFQMAGFLCEPASVVNISDLKRGMGILEKYNDLFYSLIDIFRRYHFLKMQGDELLVSEAIRSYPLKDIQSERERFQIDFLTRWPNFKPFMQLTFTCLKDYLAVLRGNKIATDVVFPGGSMQLFSGIFCGDAVADFFNDTLAEVIYKRVELQRRRRPGQLVSILEIGAGTGGASRKVLEKLNALAPGVRFLYTDISSSFTRHGAENFGKQYPWAVFKRLDIEKDLVAQGYMHSTFDIVYASNVLHDTEYILKTLSQVKSLLKPGGMLALNEFTVMKDLLLFSGGLLHGWWLFKDPEMRLEHSCLLSVEQWRKATKLAGFEEFDAYKLPFIKQDQAVRQAVMTCHLAASESVTETVSMVGAADSPNPSSTDTLDAPLQRKPSDRGANTAIYERINECLLRIVGEERIEKFSADVPFMEAGLDSIEMLEFSTGLERRFSIELNATFLFQSNTISKVTRAIEEILAAGESVTETVSMVGAADSPSPSSTDTLDAPLQRKPSDRGANTAIYERVNECLLRIVGEERIEKFSADVPFMEAGLDSIEMLEFSTGLERRFSIELDATFLFQSNTISKVTRAIEEITVNSSLRVEERRLKTAAVSHFVSNDDYPVTEASGKTDSSTRRTGLKDIAVIGMALRFPGNCETAEDFYRLLERGEEAIVTLPEGRFDWPDDVDIDGEQAYLGRGGFLQAIDEFDAAFFRISPGEAELMDPQQRLLLELSWSALEDAGYSSSALKGSNTGIYIGACHFEYRHLQVLCNPIVDPLLSTGASGSILANRLSYFYDFHGPSQMVDTACSSSLVALHQAVRGIAAGECDLALVGGCNLICSPINALTYDRAGMLSKTGKCYTFDRRANGYVRGEGGAVIVLKPLRQAEIDNDTIYGVIKGTAVNHGGQASSLTAPKPAAQSELVQRAIKDADVAVDTIGYIETHGTATPLGDPIEVEGLKQAFHALGADSNKTRCRLGSVKTNIGHLEGAAGIAGTVKALLSLLYKIIPKSVNYEQLNPEIKLPQVFEIATSTQPWNSLQDAEGRVIPRRAGISAFGFGGANAHAVLEEYTYKPVMRVEAPRPLLFVLSAKNNSRLQAYAEKLLGYLESRNDAENTLSLASFVYTLQRREAMEERVAFSVSRFSELKEKLRRLAQGQPIEWSYQGNAKAGKDLTDLISSEAELNQVFKTWISEGEIEKVARLWVKGVPIRDWSSFYHNIPPRINLPTYPFAKTRYWIQVCRKLKS